MQCVKLNLIMAKFEDKGSKMQTVIMVQSEAAMLLLGEFLGRQAQPGDLLFLFGDLGAGKTTLTKGIARGLAITDPVTSPTFQLVKSYQGSQCLNHLDLYRLKSLAELDVFDPEALVEEGITVVEWGTLLLERLQPEYLEVALQQIPGELIRQVSITPHGGRYHRFVEVLDHVDLGN
jgi:tRNA threonylcarbamoyladenosine biosynthesis protein TsaE